MPEKQYLRVRKSGKIWSCGSMRMLQQNYRCQLSMKEDYRNLEAGLRRQCCNRPEEVNKKFIF